MFAVIKTIWQKIKNIFSKKLKSTSEHWINHIHDETVTWPNSALMWANVHGFDEGPGQTYWLGIDIRSFGIRCADYVLKFKSKALYDEFLNAAINSTESFLYKMRGDSRMNYTNGSDMDVEYVFKWGDEEKTFHVHLGVDSYAEEK